MQRSFLACLISSPREEGKISPQFQFDNNENAKREFMNFLSPMTKCKNKIHEFVNKGNSQSKTIRNNTHHHKLRNKIPQQPLFLTRDKCFLLSLLVRDFLNLFKKSNFGCPREIMPLIRLYSSNHPTGIESIHYYLLYSRCPSLLLDHTE